MKNINFKPWTLLLVFVAVVTLTFLIGLNKDELPKKNLKAQAETESIKTQGATLQKKMIAMRTRLEQLQALSDSLDAKVNAQPVAAAELAALKPRLAKLQEPQSQLFEMPADSPSGRVKNLPKTASGVPQKVLNEYAVETGVSPAEIESLMRR